MDHSTLKKHEKSHGDGSFSCDRTASMDSPDLQMHEKVLSEHDRVNVVSGKASAQTMGVKKVAYPCPVCDETSSAARISCTGCGKWVHLTCAPMDQEDFYAYATTAEYFICQRCVSGSASDKFDFSKCLMR